MRASDAERDHAVEALRGHAADGRLDLAELEERVATALEARTQGELAELTADLPARERRRRRRRADLQPYLAVMVLLDRDLGGDRRGLLLARVADARMGHPADAGQARVLSRLPPP